MSLNFFDMKKLFYYLLIPFLFLGCSKEQPSLLRITIPIQSFSVDAALNPFMTHYIPINNVTINAMAALDAAGIDTASITKILPGSATLTVPFNDAKLNFIQAMSIRICKLGDNRQNCGKEIFFREPVPENANFDLGLVPSDIGDIRDFLFEQTVNLQVKLERMRDNPQGTFDVQVELDFRVL